MTDQTASTLKQVQVKRRIGRGGMADVYLGVHTSLGHKVAVKVLHAHLLDDDELRRRFHDEARAVAGLRHPNIVQIHDFVLVDDRPLIIMELLEGPSLSEFVAPLHKRGERLPLATVANLMSQIADALDYAHAKGIVHRDVKPANIVLRSDSSPVVARERPPADLSAVLTDFGVARLASATSATATGALLGTPAYMAPEQVLGEAVGPRADIYALGVVLYELLAGCLPFSSQDSSPAAVLFKHVHETPDPLPGESGPLQEVISRALAKRPQDRYMTAGDLVLDLKRAAGGGRPEPVTIRSRRPKSLAGSTERQRSRSKRRRRQLWLAATAGIALLLGAVGLAAWTAFADLDLLAGSDPTRPSGESGVAVAGSATGTPHETNQAASGLASGTLQPANAGAEPTASESATSGPSPTSGPTTDPTDTPRPTATPTSSPTNTPSPTDTPRPTKTPEPTDTPRPTNTPTPTPLLDEVDPDDVL